MFSTCDCGGMSSTPHRGTGSVAQEEGKPSSQGARRAAYLQTSIQLRELAKNAHSTETRRALRQLAVLYQELAEYAVTSATRRPTDEERPDPSQTSKERDAG